VASSRGCTSCPEGQGWINDGCTCRQPLAALEEGSAEAWGEEVPPGLESAAEGDLPYFPRSEEASLEATEAFRPMMAVDLAVDPFHQVGDDWGTTIKRREAHTKELYKALVADIEDAMRKDKVMTAKLEEMNAKVQAWFALKQ